jgi:hypothetical protein
LPEFRLRHKTPWLFENGERRFALKAVKCQGTR